LKFQISNLKLFDNVASRGLADEAMTTSRNSWDVVPPVLGCANENSAFDLG
jgi:hypothetical protein